MKIKKIGHCCLLIKTNNITILTDPGNFSVDQNLIIGIDVILITHEHADHFHIDSLKIILKNNPQVKIITNSGVGEKLNELNIQHIVLEDLNKININNISIEAFNAKHEEIFSEVGQVQNTAYLIDNTLFYPGDSFHNPTKKVDILALPVAGPWCRISDAIKYALSIKPNKVFPVHDGMLQKDRIGSYHKVPEKILSENGIEFVVISEGDEKEF